MQIFFFVLAVAMTGIASMYNLCNGYIDEATWISLLLTILVIVMWLLWGFVAISRSSKVKTVTGGVALVFLIAAAGSLLYSFSTGLESSLIRGLGLACGTLFVLPLAGFSKIAGGISPYLAVVPYLLLIVLSGIIAAKVEKSGMAVAYLQKKEEKMQKKEEKKKEKKADNVKPQEESYDAPSEEGPEEKQEEKEQVEIEAADGTEKETEETEDEVLTIMHMNKKENAPADPGLFEEIIVEEAPEADEEAVRDEEDLSVKHFFRDKQNKDAVNPEDEIKIIR